MEKPQTPRSSPGRTLVDKRIEIGHHPLPIDLAKSMGDLLEEIMLPLLQDFCDNRRLYLDKKGIRSAQPGHRTGRGNHPGFSRQSFCH